MEFQEQIEPGIRIGFKTWNDLIMTIIFLSISATGIIFNVTLLFGTIKEKLYHTSSNLFIMNLAVSDLTIAIGIIFFPTLNYAMYAWPFGDIGCKIFEVIRDSVTPISLLSLTALSYERYQAVFAIGVSRPSNRRESRFTVRSCICSRTGGIILMMWLATFFTLIPITILGNLPNLPPEKIADQQICMLDRYEYLEPKILVVIRCTITYVIPLCIIAYNYCAIAWKLFNISKNLHKYRETPAMDRSRRKALSRSKIILLLVIVFVFCSFPCHFFLWIFYFARDDVIRTTYFWDNWRVIGFYLFYVYPILNPLFLYATSEQYKTMFDKYLFRCGRGRVVADDDEEDESTDTELKAKSSRSKSAGTEEISFSGTSHSKMSRPSV